MDCKKVFLDTNILLDYLIDRDEFSINADMIFEKIVSGQIECLIAAHSVLNIFYILRRYYTVEARKLMLSSLSTLCRVCPVTDTLIRNSLESTAEDIEDYIQLKCAEQAGADYFITRDPAGFKTSSIPVLSPHEFLKL